MVATIDGDGIVVVGVSVLPFYILGYRRGVDLLWFSVCRGEQLVE